MKLDHVTIRTHQLALNRDFLISVLPLVEGPRPASIIAAVDGHWLYFKDWPLLHLIKSAISLNEDTEQQAEAIDHFAFVMDEDYKQFKEKLRGLNIPFQRNHMPELNRKRIFFHTPTKILIEVIFEQ
ncbi:MAG: glyoxalase [Pedobacter sp.]|nr:MAG: glyoxalase [Pedobacter sp.]